MPVRVAGFIAAVALLACAYRQLAINGMQMVDGHFWAATILMLAGTFLFFWSVAGFTIFALTHARGVYLKGIRMFTVRQIASKVNTAFVSMGVVCVMLFLALTTASVGMGLLETFAGNIEQVTRYDATIIASARYFDDPDSAWQDRFRQHDGDIAACLASRSQGWDETIDASAQVDRWPLGVTYGTLFDQIPGVEGMENADTLSRMGRTEMQVVSASQYNASCALIGEPGIRLAGDGFAVDNTVVGYDELAQAMSGPDIVLDVAGTSLHGADLRQNVPLDTSAIDETALVVIVPDEVAAALRDQMEFPSYSYLNVMYRHDRMQGDEELARVLAEATPLSNGASPLSSDIEDRFEATPWPVTNVYTGRAMADQAGGLRMVIAFLALYIGFVMLVATAAVLAIQQLSETADSLGRYRRLSDLGCDMRCASRRWCTSAPRSPWRHAIRHARCWWCRGRCSASLASTRRSSSASPPGRSWASTRCTWSRPTCSRRASSAARCSTGGLRKRTGRRTAPAAVALSGGDWHAGHEDGTQRRGMACWSRGWCAAARNGALVPFAARWVPKTCPTT